MRSLNPFRAAALLLLALSLSGCGYNQIQQKDEAVSAGWSEVLNQYQRRADLIPNLVNTVKGYAQHEQGILEEITRLRSQWGEAKSTSEKVEAASGLEGALGRLMVVVENYPDLKANQNFIALQDELAGTENRINVERQRFNESVQAYNVTVRQFPTALVARLAGFQTRAPFAAAQGAETAPTVQF